MESRLEAYRAKKRQVQEADQKREKYWDLITLASLRKRVFGSGDTAHHERQANVDVSINYIFAICTLLYVI